MVSRGMLVHAIGIAFTLLRLESLSFVRFYCLS